ncbi:MAG: lipid A biosynthesis lauroyl acyltransferase [Pseudomonadota bacterium]
MALAAVFSSLDLTGVADGSHSDRLDRKGTAKFLKSSQSDAATRRQPNALAMHAVFSLHRAFAVLPWPVRRAAGRAIGRLARVLLKQRREIAAANIARCLPALAPNEHERLLREHFDALGIGVMELGLAWYGSEAELARRASIVGAEHLATARAQGRGVLLVCGHFTTLDVCNRLLAPVARHAGVWRPLGNPVADRWTRNGRLRGAAELFEKSAFRRAIRWLRGGGALLMAADQADRSEGAITASFFGHDAATNVTAWRLARSTGCVLVPVVAGRDADNRYVLEFDAPLDGITEQTAPAAAAALNAAIERQARRYPAQYYWIHRRFKSEKSA